MVRTARHLLILIPLVALAAGCEGAPPWDSGPARKPHSPTSAEPQAGEPAAGPAKPVLPETADAALADFLAAGNIAETPVHRDARVDLDGDGREELLMLLEDRNWCGSGGCTLLVFRNGERGYRLLSRTGATSPPIAVSARVHNGWHDLLVGVGGGGTVAGTVALQFNGSGYPGNPALLALLAPDALPPARVVID